MQGLCSREAVRNEPGSLLEGDDRGPRQIAEDAVGPVRQEAEADQNGLERLDPGAGGTDAQRGVVPAEETVGDGRGGSCRLRREFNGRKSY